MKIDRVHFQQMSRRLFGEMFNRRLFASDIMMQRIGSLINQGSDKSLDCLFKLLVIVGLRLESVRTCFG